MLCKSFSFTYVAIGKWTWNRHTTALIVTRHPLGHLNEASLFYHFCGSPWIFIQINNFLKLPVPGIKPLTLGSQVQRTHSTPRGNPFGLATVWFFSQMDTMCCCTNLRISNPSSLFWKIATREAEWSCTYVLNLYFSGMCNLDGGCIFQNKAKDDDLPNCTLVHFDNWVHLHECIVTRQDFIQIHFC